jgi:hypothetical protein
MSGVFARLERHPDAGSGLEAQGLAALDAERPEDRDAIEDEGPAA